MVNALRQRSVPALLCFLCLTVFFNLVSELLPDSGVIAKVAVVAVAVAPVVLCVAAGLFVYLALRRRIVLAGVAVMCVGLGLVPWGIPVYAANRTVGAVGGSSGPTVTVAFANVYRGGASESDVVALASSGLTRGGGSAQTVPHADVVIAAESHYAHQRRVTKALAKTHRQLRLTGRYGVGETLGLWLSRTSRWTISEGAYTPVGARVFRLTLTQSQGADVRTVHVIGLHAHHPLFEPIADWNHDVAAAAAALRTADGAAVVIGDFNQSLASPRLALWAKRNNLYSCRSRRQNMVDGTWTPPKMPVIPLISIDHVFTRNAACQGTATVSLSQSDHHGLVATVRP